MEAWETWSWFWIYLGFIILVLSGVVIWIFRKHPLIVVRNPVVFGADLMINGFNVFMQSWPFILRANLVQIPCFPLEAFSDAFDVLGNSVLIGRAVLFYMQALSIQGIKRNAWVETVIDGIAFLTAPGDYYVLKDKVRALEARESVMVTENMHITHSRFYRTPFARNMRFAIVQFCWFMLGWNYSLWACFGNMGSRIIVWDNVDGNANACWTTYVYPYSFTEYMIVTLVCGYILAAVYPVRDLIGLRNDLVFTLVFTTIMKFINGLSIMWNFLGDSGAWTYPPSVLVAPIISLAITCYYLWKVNSQSDAAVQKAENFKNYKDLIEYWKTSNGKQLIINLSKMLYTYESTKFLIDTEAKDWDLVRARAIYQLYIADGSTLEVNVPAKLKKRFEIALQNENWADFAATVEDARTEVFQLLLPLMKSELASQSTVRQLFAVSSDAHERRAGTSTTTMEEIVTNS
jgi:hypothetical protein